MVFLAAGALAVAFLLWCLTHFLLDSGRPKHRTVSVAQIRTHTRNVQIIPFPGTSSSRRYRTNKAG